MACGPLAFPEPLSGVHKVKLSFTTLRSYCPFHCVDICIDGAQGKVGKVAGALAQNKAVARNYASSH